ncbi:RNA polymerase subunit sigma-24 [Stieleria sp. TO1_6]|uniref:RNA polymerase sigma factor n=1 Tax=Stieleria tagensis TaxID=2956795 RepID=UPI00209BB139|nr:sigma factor [Stieleria tagensis]MCO8122323.1 RNA polymerase subunit sigma-24 [Stieleria tagensis]
MTLAGRLPTTRWSLVIRAGEASIPAVDRQLARQSLEELCQMYWPALYGYLRRRGKTCQDAEDLIQGFFADLLERESIGAADASRGRFRAFLYASLDHFVANQQRRENALARGGNQAVISLDRSLVAGGEQAFSAEELADAQQDPSATFDREWARCLIRQTLRTLSQEYTAKGKGEWFNQLAPMLTSTEITSKQREKIAKQLGLSATALKVAIHRLRTAYRQRLIDAVAQTVDHPTDCGKERQWLFEALGKPQ